MWVAFCIAGHVGWETVIGPALFVNGWSWTLQKTNVVQVIRIKAGKGESEDKRGSGPNIGMDELDFMSIRDLVNNFRWCFANTKIIPGTLLTKSTLCFCLYLKITGLWRIWFQVPFQQKNLLCSYLFGSVRKKFKWIIELLFSQRLCWIAVGLPRPSLTNNLKSQHALRLPIFGPSQHYGMNERWGELRLQGVSRHVLHATTSMRCFRT